eukprot:Seg2207.2 transcript_id=Seg2207.2/GoldUCD/mRNA.D3Y31 product=Pinin protein_id=Seg2207.2/GoldUCD/D3Y31
MTSESLEELQKAAQELRDGLKNVDEDIKKLTGRDPAENQRPGNRKVQLKRNNLQRGNRPEEPLVKQRRESGSSGTRRWGRTVQIGSWAPSDGNRLDSSDDEDDSSKPAIQSVVAAEIKPARLQPKEKVEDTKTASRNRRMFGFLIGTLQKFKEDTRQKTMGERKREEIEKKLEQKAEVEKQELSTQRRELFQTRKQKQIELKNLERKMENAVLKEEIRSHNVNLEHFILLKATPPLFYLPARHTETTRRRLDESIKELKESQEIKFNEMDFMDDTDLHGSVNRRMVRGKKIREERIEVKEVGQRDLFEEDREQEELERKLEKEERENTGDMAFEETGVKEADSGEEECRLNGMNTGEESRKSFFEDGEERKENGVSECPVSNESVEGKVVDSKEGPIEEEGDVENLPDVVSNVVHSIDKSEEEKESEPYNLNVEEDAKLQDESWKQNIEIPTEVEKGSTENVADFSHSFSWQGHNVLVDQPIVTMEREDFQENKRDDQTTQEGLETGKEVTETSNQEDIDMQTDAVRLVKDHEEAIDEY